MHDFFANQNALQTFLKELNYSKLFSKRLILENAKNRSNWLTLFPESDKYIFSSNIPVTSKFALKCASYNFLIGLNFFLFVEKTLVGMIRLFRKGYGT